MTVLFVNACLRGDESRTLTLCREYLEGIEDVKEVNLSTVEPEDLLSYEVFRYDGRKLSVAREDVQKVSETVDKVKHHKWTM